MDQTSTKPAPSPAERRRTALMYLYLADWFEAYGLAQADRPVPAALVRRLMNLDSKTVASVAAAAARYQQSLT